MYMLFFCKRKIIFEKDSGGIFAKYLGKRLTFQRDLIVNLKIRNFKGVPRFITVLHRVGGGGGGGQFCWVARHGGPFSLSGPFCCCLPKLHCKKGTKYSPVLHY